MEQALKLMREEEDGPFEAKPPQGEPDSPDGLDKILKFALPGRGAEPERPGSFTPREMTRLMDLVHEAARAVRAAEERSRDYDARTKALAERASQEIHNAEARAVEAEARARAAEARAAEAETRAREADNWLRQIFMTVSEEFPVRRVPRAD